MSNVFLRAVILALVAALMGLVFNQIRPGLRAEEDRFAGGIAIGASVLEQKAAVVEGLRENARREGSRPRGREASAGASEGSPSDASETAANGAEGRPSETKGSIDPSSLDFRLELDEVQALFRTEQAFFLDARPRLEYEAGHIPGARVLPPDQYQDRMFELAAELPVDDPIIVYCSGGDCSASLQVAQRLTMDGYPNVHVYEGGFPEWQGAGMPSVEGPMP